MSQYAPMVRNMWTKWGQLKVEDGILFRYYPDVWEGVLETCCAINQINSFLTFARKKKKAANIKKIENFKLLKVNGPPADGRPVFPEPVVASVVVAEATDLAGEGLAGQLP